MWPIWLYLDAEVLVLPPVFLPQDSVFVGRRLCRQPRYLDREVASSTVTAGATADTTEGNSRASRESGSLCSQKQRNAALTLAHAQTIHYTSDQATP